jgi:hypothetical protein
MKETMTSESTTKNSIISGQAMIQNGFKKIMTQKQVTSSSWSITVCGLKLLVSLHHFHFTSLHFVTKTLFCSFHAGVPNESLAISEYIYFLLHGIYTHFHAGNVSAWFLQAGGGMPNWGMLNIVAEVKVVNSFLLSYSLFLPGSGLAIRVEINGTWSRVCQMMLPDDDDIRVAGCRRIQTTLSFAAPFQKVHRSFNWGKGGGGISRILKKKNRLTFGHRMYE